MVRIVSCFELAASPDHPLVLTPFRCGEYIMLSVICLVLIALLMFLYVLEAKRQGYTADSFYSFRQVILLAHMTFCTGKPPQ